MRCDVARLGGARGQDRAGQAGPHAAARGAPPAQHCPAVSTYLEGANAGDKWEGERRVAAGRWVPRGLVLSLGS